jgi:hypothetical protein
MPAGSTLRVDFERTLDLDRARDLDLLLWALSSLLGGRTCVSWTDPTTDDCDALTLGGGALDDDRRDGAMDAERPLDDTTEEEACVIALLSPAGCLDLDLARLFLAIDRDLPLEGTNSEWSLFDRPRPRTLYSSGR